MIGNEFHAYKSQVLRVFPFNTNQALASKNNSKQEKKNQMESHEKIIK